MFHCALFAATISALGLAAGVCYFKSLEAIAWCILATFLLSFIQCYTLLYQRVFQHAITPFLQKLTLPFAISVLLFVAMWLVHPWAERFDTIVSLLLKGIIFILTYALLLQLTGERQTMSHYFRRK